MSYLPISNFNTNHAEFSATGFFTRTIKEQSALGYNHLPGSSSPAGPWCVQSCRWAEHSWQCWRVHPDPCLLTAGIAGRTVPRSPHRTGREHGREAAPSKEDLRSNTGLKNTAEVGLRSKVGVGKCESLSNRLKKKDWVQVQVVTCQGPEFKSNIVQRKKKKIIGIFP
jgi:hypothetical protein